MDEQKPHNGFLSDIIALEKPLPSNGRLMCAFPWCYFEADDFRELAEHVRLCHVLPGQNQQGETDEMLRPPSGNAASGRAGTADAGGRKKPTVPFLSVEDLGSDPVTAKILGVDIRPSKYNDITVKLAVRGRSYFLGMKDNNPNYEVLFNGLGPDENKWMGQEILMGLEFNDFYEKQFITVFEAPAKGEKRKREK